MLWSIGICLAGCIRPWMDYKIRPVQSAPFYILQLLPRTATPLGVLAVGALIYGALRR